MSGTNKVIIKENFFGSNQTDNDNKKLQAVQGILY